MQMEQNNKQKLVGDAQRLYEARNQYFLSEHMKKEAKSSFVERWRAMCKYDMSYNPSEPTIISSDLQGKKLAGINDLLGISMPIFCDDKFLFMIGLGYFGDDIQKALAKSMKKIADDKQQSAYWNIMIIDNKQDAILAMLCDDQKDKKDNTFKRLYQEFIDKKTDTQGVYTDKWKNALCKFQITFLHALRVFKNQKPGLYDRLITTLKKKEFLKPETDFNTFDRLSVNDILINTPEQYQAIYQVLGKNVNTKEQHMFKSLFSCLFNSIYVEFDQRYQEIELILKKTAHGLLRDIFAVDPATSNKRPIITSQKSDGDYVDHLAPNHNTLVVNNQSIDYSLRSNS